MFFLGRLKVKAKLIGVFSLILLLLCIISAIAVRSLLYSTEVADYVHVLVSERFEKVVVLNNDLVSTNTALSDYLTPGNITDVRRRDYETAFARVTKEIEALANEPALEEEMKAISDLSYRYNYLYQIVVTPLVEAGRPYDALAFYLSEMQPMSSQMVNITGTMCRELLKGLNTAVARMQDMTQVYLVLGLAILAVGIGMGIAFYFSHIITKHLNYAVKVANTIANNDLQIDIKVTSNDEFGDLAKALILMRNDLSKSISMVRQLANLLSIQLEETKSSSDIIVNSSKEAETQAINVAAASNQMVSTTREIAANCETAARLSDQSRSVTCDSVDLIRNTIADIKLQSEHTVEDALKVQALAEQTQKIGSIVGTIDEIAAQTNLLALNAAIEAARAGEAGRGFAVVADEVRALASRTSQSTQEISAMVQQIQEDANAATDSMHNSVETMNSVAERANTVESTLNSILDFVGQVNDQIRMIATSAEEQTTATSEISANMQRISADSEEIVQSANDSTANCDKSVATIHELVGNMDRFKLYEELSKADLQKQFLDKLDKM